MVALLVGAAFFLISTPRTADFLQWGIWVPLFLLLRGTTPRWDFLLGWLAGIGLNLAGFYWIVHTISVFSNLPTPIALFALLLFALYGGLPYGMLGYLLPRLRSAFGSAAIFLVPMCWVALEFVFPQIFPYHQGDLQFRNLPVYQVAALTGIGGVSFLVMASNMMWLELIDARRGKRPWPVASAFVLAVIFAGVLFWGSNRVKELDAAIAQKPQVKVGLIQGNYGVHEMRKTTAEKMFERYRALSTEAAQKGATLVIWGEGSSPYSPWKKWAEIHKLASELNVDLLLGAGGRSEVNGKVLRYNSAYALRQGEAETVRYDKNILLAFGEYMPGSKLFPWLKGKIKGIGDFTAGEGATLFRYPQARYHPDGGLQAQGEVKALPLICYEAILDGYVNEQARKLEPNLLVNISHDDWFGDTACPHQFLMLVAARAVEHGTAVARVANTGISAVIDPTGRIRGQTPLFRQSATVESVTIERFSTLYQRIGEGFSILCTVLAGLCIVLLRRFPGPRPTEPPAA